MVSREKTGEKASPNRQTEKEDIIFIGLLLLGEETFSYRGRLLVDVGAGVAVVGAGE